MTELVPKPMVPFRGTTLIAQGMEKVLRSIPDVHVTVGYKKAMLANHVVELGARTVVNTEGEGNAWWLYHSLLGAIDEPVFVLTCDNVTDLDFGLLAESYYAVGAPACMLVGVPPVKGLEGDFIFRDGQRVTAIDRKTPGDIYCTGIQVMNPARIRKLTTDTGDFYKVWSQLIAQNELYVSPVYPDRWISIDTIDALMEYGRAEA
jgi:NDP-sugar pyrophosphorylase family protein